MRDARLLWSGLALVAVAVLGGIVTMGSPPGGLGWMNSMGTHDQMMWPGQEASGTAGEPIPGAAELVVGAYEFGFSPTTITVEEDVPVNVTLDNAGSLLHDLTIQDLGFRIVAGGGETVTGGLVPEAPGTYAFECSIPGHAQAGMTGKLIVASLP